MSRRIVSYIEGRAVWEDLGPTQDVQWGAHIGGRAIEERGPKPKPIVERKPRDYHASVAKGHETRRLRGIG